MKKFGHSLHKAGTSVTKITALFASLCLAFAVISCSSGDDDSSSTKISTTPSNPGDPTNPSSPITSVTFSFDTADLAVTSESDQTVIQFSNVKKNVGEKFIKSDFPSVTARTGYTFAGWYMDSTYSTVFSEFTVSAEKSEVRLYGKFNDSNGNPVKVYKISYVSSKRAVEPKLTTGLVSKFIKAEQLGYDNFFHCGWFYDAEYTKPVLLGDTITKNTTFYGKWLSFSDLNAQTGTGFDFTELSPTDFSELYEKGSVDYPELGGVKKYTRFTGDTFTRKNYYYFPAGDTVLPKAGSAGATVWQYRSQGSLGIKIKSDYPYKTDYLDLPSQGSNRELKAGTTTEINFLNIQSFVLVKATGKGIVRADLVNKNAVTSVASAAFVDETGKVLVAKSLDKDSAEFSLSCDVDEAKSVYLVYHRNGDNTAGGSLGVRRMYFEKGDTEVTNANVAQTILNATEDISIKLTEATNAVTIKSIAAAIKENDSVKVSLDLSDSGLTVINDEWFKDCTTLQSMKLPDTVTEIGARAFSGCSSLEQVVLSQNLMKIGEEAFYECTSLATLDLPESLTTIEFEAFCWMTSLTNLTIGKNVVDIARRFVAQCNNLQTLTFEDTKNWCKNTNVISETYDKSWEPIDVSVPATNARVFRTAGTGISAYPLKKISS